MALRMGQACGSKSTGAWGTTEWLPIMVKSSVALGCLPRLRGVSDESTQIDYFLNASI